MICKFAGVSRYFLKIGLSAGERCMSNCNSNRPLGSGTEIPGWWPAKLKAPGNVRSATLCVLEPAIQSHKVYTQLMQPRH